MLSAIFRSSVTRFAGLQVHSGIRAMSTSASPFTTLVVSHPAEFVTQVELNRPNKLNAMNQAFWSEMIDCFNEISADPNCRAVVVSGAGRVFTSGLDLMDMASVIMQPEGDDVARISWNLQKVISRYQETFTVLEKCSKPVIVAIHGACVGGGVDLITACDVRLCTQDAWFQVKEVDVGLAADVGTLQRLPKVIGSRSLVNDMALTARKVFSDEAQISGLVSRVFPDKDAMMAAALEMAGQMVARSPVGVNNVLFLTIMNLKYPITTDVLYTIFNNCGCVQRITIFHKNKAMVEFDSVQSAQRARASLNGADIYSGCCTLKIEYAKPTRLKVFKNDRDTWDYTTPAVDATEDGAANTNKRPRQPALLGDHPPEYSGYHGYDKSYETAPYENRRMGPPARGRGGRTGYGPSYGPPPPPPGEYGARSDSPVVMVYGLDNKMNADLVFNIFCLYGNVERVKFIKSKPGAAMVEMGDCYAVDRAITHLNNNFLFGQKLNVCVSKQQAIVQRQSYELEDNSSSFKEFRGSRNNRFTSPEHAAKTGIQHPSNVLHFFNAQPDATTEIFSRICEELGVKSPANVKLFTGKSGAAPSDRSASGLLEWESINDAMEALALMNHYQMKNSTGPYPYTLRLCFSTVQHTN